MTTPTTTLSEDGLQLTVDVVQADGRLRSLTVTRSPNVGPFTPADVEKVVAAALEADRIMPGEKRTTRRLNDRVMVHVATGPPTWWIPRVEITRRSVMVVWLRGLVAISLRDRA